MALRHRLRLPHDGGGGRTALGAAGASTGPAALVPEKCPGGAGSGLAAPPRQAFAIPLHEAAVPGQGRGQRGAGCGRGGPAAAGERHFPGNRAGRAAMPPG